MPELRQATGSNAFDLIQQLRPQYLRRRGASQAPAVFLDNIPRGGVDALRQIPALDVAEIRYLDSRAATQQFGTGYSGGIILVLTATPPAQAPQP
jgi:hypothetical protein